MNSLKLILTTFILNFLMMPLFAASPEFGKATYYNDKYHGKKTASGELYDREKFTCAHKTLKFGTIIRVTRIDNQLSVEARVNDRGPYSEGFVIDLSYKAAEQIGLIKSGSVNVKVEVVEPEVKPSSSSLKEVPVKTAGSAGSSGLSKAPVNYSSPGVPMKPDLVTKGTTAPSAPTLSPTYVKPDGTEKKAQLTTTATAATAQPLPIEPALYQTTILKVAERGYGVQLQSLTSADAALNEVAKLQVDELWRSKVMLKTGLDKTGETQYKIILGPFEAKKDAELQQKAAAKKGHKKCFVIDLAQ